MENVRSTREEDSYLYTRNGFTVASLCPGQNRAGKALDILENKNRQTNQPLFCSVITRSPCIGSTTNSVGT